MLQVNFIKNNKEEVIERLSLKNFTDLNLINQVIELDDERKKLQFEFDEKQSKINTTSKKIG
jgi:seryl-tRNA synthetase